MPPLISVVITNYNYAEYVGQAIESVLNQTHDNLEIIVINDGSSDDSDQVIQGYVASHPQIIYVNQDNIGANLTRNIGLGMAHGEYVFLLDADNVLNPSHLEQVCSVAESAAADVVYTDLQYFGESDALLTMPEFDIDILKAENVIDTAALIRKECVGDNRFDPELNRKFLQDWDFFLGLALKGAKIVKASGVSVQYRIHGRQNGNTGATIERLDEYVAVYQYIIGKYTKLYPSQFPGHVQWSNDAVMRMVQLRKDKLYKDDQIEALRWEVGNYQKEITAILDSHSYKIGRFLGTPVRAYRRLRGTGQ